VIYCTVYQWCEFKSRRGKNTNVTAQKSNSNTAWFNFQTYVIFSSNLVSQVPLRSSGTDMVYGCRLLRYLYNLLYFLWLHTDFLIILYNILIIAELYCCQIIIICIHVPSTYAQTRVLCLSLDSPYETRQHFDYWSSILMERMRSSDLGRWT
jgi:hypothetical protein